MLENGQSKVGMVYQVQNMCLAFAIENHSELFGYIFQGNLNIRIHRNITGEMWFGVGWGKIVYIINMLLLFYSLKSTHQQGVKPSFST